MSNLKTDLSPSDFVNREYKSSSSDDDKLKSI